jgi:hypothetical protein
MDVCGCRKRIGWRLGIDDAETEVVTSDMKEKTESVWTWYVRHLEAYHPWPWSGPVLRLGGEWTKQPLEGTMPVSCEISFSETILPERDSLGVRGGLDCD